MARDTLIDFFRDISIARGDFLVHDDGFRSRTHSYRDVGNAARAFAARLDSVGLTKGDNVLFWSENRPEWIVAFWGCLLRGIVVVPIDYRASPDFLIRVGRIVSAKLILIGQDVPPIRETIDARIWRLPELDWDAKPDPHLPDVAIARDDIAEIIFTSGATAEPKGVIITHRNVLANVVPVEGEVVKYRKWGKPFYPLRFLNLLPLSHMFGQAMATFIPPMIPGVVVFMRGYNPVDIAAQIKSRRISVLVSVPKILDVLREHAARTDACARALHDHFQNSGAHFLRRWWIYRAIHRLLGWKFWAFVVGAAPLDPSLESFWNELGYVVVQGYGLTETAPIISLNHPFGTKAGSVGKAIAGVEVKVAPDGEILVRGENVTKGYYNAVDETARAFEDGWFHTGDIGEIGADGQMYIRGRKKEMIVTPEGLNVFPEDVEQVLDGIDGVRESAVVGVPVGSEERVHAVMVVAPGADVDAIVREANGRLQDHQKIRRALVWPGPELPRTEGTKKLKRAAIRDWVRAGGAPLAVKTGADQLAALLAKYAGGSALSANTSLEQLGLSSLDRVELMVAIEDVFQTHLDEAAFSEARDVGQLRALVARTSESAAPPPEPVDFPSWNRSLAARVMRRISLPTWILPLARVFARMRVEGLDNLRGVDRPVMFASNHQSHMDTPCVMIALPPRLRYRLATAMAKEFFKAHFFPEQFGRKAWFTNSLNYYLASLFFNAFPLPQREAGARQTLRYIGEVLEGGFSVLIYPEGERTEAGEIKRFRPGIGMIASRLGVPVVPVRIEGLDKVLHHTWRMAKPGLVRVAFGKPITLTGDDYEALAKQVEDAVRNL
ncbi:MAG TPA: AMP-binding protein [Vicinamibacterales bacterium]|nr:AMP-binding protein [Vicinamibacterales bacterium]